MIVEIIVWGAVVANCVSLVSHLRLRRGAYELGLVRGQMEGRLQAQRMFAALLPDEMACHLTQFDAKCPRWMREANAQARAESD